MSVFLLAFLLLANVDPGLLAPGPREWSAQVQKLRERLAEADAIGSAEARLHNRLAQGPIQGKALCATEENRSLVARSRIFGAAYRDAVQSARADADRLRRMMAEPTLQPLLWKDQRQAAEGLLDRVEAHSVRYREMASWQQRHLATAAKSCPVVPVPAEGLGGSATGRVAVIALGGGRICPWGLPADGRVLVLPGAGACYEPGESCGCKPVPQAPGAVLGPAETETDSSGR